MWQQYPRKRGRESSGMYLLLGLLIPMYKCFYVQGVPSLSRSIEELRFQNRMFILVNHQISNLVHYLLQKISYLNQSYISFNCTSNTCVFLFMNMQHGESETATIFSADFKQNELQDDKILQNLCCKMF